MPPRGKKVSASAKKPKGPSPRTKRAVPKPAVPTEANEPEECKTPEPEIPSNAVEEEKVFDSEAVSNDDVEEEQQVPEPEVLTDTIEGMKDTEAEVLPSAAKEEETAAEVLSSPVVEKVEFSSFEETKITEKNFTSEELLDSKEAEEIMDGVNESNDIQVDHEQTIDEQGIEQDSAEEETIVEDKNIGDDVVGADEGADKVEDVDKSGSDDEEDNEESDDEEEEDHSLYMHAPLSDKKKQKDFEIFIGGLDREAGEEDLIKVFGEYGEIQSARIVKHPTTKKSKGFAFIRYATIEQAKKVLAELKDGTEVRGKRVGISASQDNDTLYLGNICKTWTKDNVIAALKGYGIEQIDEIFLPDDPKNEGKIKGYSIVEFSTHSDAMAAFQRLRKPDAVFGSERSAKVAFAPSSMHPSDEIISQVKTVYIEGLPESWNEEKIVEHCKQYGEVESVQLSRNFTKARRRDFGFIAFTSRESAIACVEGMNNAQIGEGEIKVKANIAKPQNKGRLAKQGTRGGFKVKDGEHTESGGYNMKGNAKLKRDIGKGKVHSKLKSGRGGKTFRSQGKVTPGRGGVPFQGQGGAPPPFQYHQKREQPFRGGKRNARFMHNEQPSKKARDNHNFRNTRGRSSGNRNNSRFGKSRNNYDRPPAAYMNPYPPAHGSAPTSYQGGAYGAVSGSKRRYSDMEPHAGYVKPAGKQFRGPYAYGQGSAGGYEIQGTSAGVGYVGGPVPQYSQVPEYSSYAGYEAGYMYPNNAAYPPRRAYR